jgi:hypothetical protein
LMFTPPHFAAEKENLKLVPLFKQKFESLHKEINLRKMNTIERPLLDFGMLTKEDSPVIQKTQMELSNETLLSIPLPQRKTIDVNALFDTSNPNNRPRSMNLKPQLPPLPIRVKKLPSPTVSPRQEEKSISPSVSPQLSPRSQMNRGDLSPRKLPPIPKKEEVKLNPVVMDDRPKSMNGLQKERPRHSMLLPGQRPPQYNERSYSHIGSPKPSDVMNIPLPIKRNPPQLPERKEKDPFADLNPINK